MKLESLEEGLNRYLGTNEAPPVESWRIFRRLIGHDNDVQDLGWSYDSSILVSVGLDSKVVVWSGHTFEKLKTIASHQSHVKGLTFDPANKYFATASDDRTVKIFRFTPPGPNSSAYDQMNNFVLEKTINAPFASSPLTTYFRRCSWSPDGNHIAAANAVNGPVSSVAIINRGTWESDIHLIGHEGPVEVCAFSPRLFAKQPLDKGPKDHKGTPTPHLVTVIACAGQDKALSIWITSNPRPLVITQDLAVKPISDLAWSPDGKNLFVTSLDGSILALMFEESELGYGVGLEENERSLAKFGAGRRGAGMVEGPGGLLLEEQSKAGELRGVEGRMGALMGDARPDGSVNGTSPAIPSSVVQVNGNTPEIRNGDIGVRPAEVSSGNQLKQKTQEDQNMARLEKLKSRVTIKDGKKRIAPLLISSSGTAESSLPRPQLLASKSNVQGAANDTPQTILDLSKPFDGLPRGGLTALLLGNRRKLALIDGDENDRIEKRIASSSRDGAVPILDNTENGLVSAQACAPLTGQVPTPDFIRPAVVNPTLVVSQVRLAVPKIRSQVIRTLGGNNSTPVGASDPDISNGTQVEIVFEARNPTGVSSTGRPQDREPARIAVTRKGQPLWQDFLPKSVLLVAGGREFWAAACEDASIYAWTPAGRRMISALVLESQPVILESKGWWLLCITAVGMCFVWNMKTVSSPHPPVSLAPVLDIAIHSLQGHPTTAPAITSARLNSEGRIVVSLTNGDGYAYSPTMFVWQRLSEVWWAVGSQYWNTTDSSVGDLRSSSARKGEDAVMASVSAGIIPFLERSTTNETLVRGRAYFLQRLVKQLLSREGFEGFESGVSIAHLENRLAAAMMLGAKDEFQVYLYMYARRLGAEGLKTKVEELLRGLLGGDYGDSDLVSTSEDFEAKISEDRHWDNPTSFLCGWSRSELLKSVVLILGMGLAFFVSNGSLTLSRKTSGFAAYNCTICESSRSHGLSRIK